jgi:hypothetical protein
MLLLYSRYSAKRNATARSTRRYDHQAFLPLTMRLMVLCLLSYYVSLLRALSVISGVK